MLYYQIEANEHITMKKMIFIFSIAANKLRDLFIIIVAFAMTNDAFCKSEPNKYLEIKDFIFSLVIGGN